MLFDQGAQLSLIVRSDHAAVLGQTLDIDQFRVDSAREVAVLIEDISGSSGHARREVAADRTQDDHDSTGHVLAAVVAGTLDDRDRPAIADREPFAGSARREQSASGSSVEHSVAHDDILAGHETGIFGW